LKVALVAVLTEERKNIIFMLTIFIFKQVEQSKDVVAAPMETHLSTVLKSAITDRVVRVDHGDKVGAKRAIYNCDHCGSKLKRKEKCFFSEG
jgi:demethoxyubiquinone hydroxylase (CLK1/Coq7/Cat5 family)